MTNPKEYFAETTEAFFTRNDFFPFTREELEAARPRHVPSARSGVVEEITALPPRDDMGWWFNFSAFQCRCQRRLARANHFRLKVLKNNVTITVRFSSRSSCCWGWGFF